MKECGVRTNVRGWNVRRSVSAHSADASVRARDDSGFCASPPAAPAPRSEAWADGRNVRRIVCRE
eukprot:2389775-Rhodomonas_salina.2